MDSTPHFLITLKAGIGKTFQEAELALTYAKKLKEQINDNEHPFAVYTKIRQTLLNKTYAISQYDGEPLEIRTDSLYTLKQTVEMDVFETLRDINKVIEHYGEDSLAYSTLNAQIEKRCVDTTTKALTPFGYHLTLARDVNNHYHHLSSSTDISRYRIIIDGNDMHYWNDRMGYDVVTERLRIIGSTLVSAIRKTTTERI